jgi:hypothetical protein
MSEDFATRLAEEIDRRKFLRRATGGVAAMLLGLFGVAVPASALVNYKCCTLCFSPAGSTYGTCTSSPKKWCWFCHHAADGYDYRCCETYYAGYACNGGCYGVQYSTVKRWGT